MGGGRKKDRTKGCAKPSSSARSAELLENSSGFIGFGEVDNSSILESLVVGDDVPSELKVVFKKMTKKDEVTRLKAVGEFNEIMEESGESYAKKILPYWPRIYSKIANDYDRRIRTGAQQAHLCVVKYSGRDLAPQLKSLAPTWFISCSDPHAPAASNAIKSFSLAFHTDKKMVDAIRFCLVDIMSSLEENLLNTSIHSFKDANLSAEDAENKYFRVVSSSLLAYASILDYLNEEFAQKIKLTQDRILESVKFWKYSKNKNSMIRSSWFKLICKMCERCQELSIFHEDNYEKLISILFTNLEETDPIVAPIIWDCCLHIMLSYSNWRESIDVQKTVLSQLYHFLENGCSGNGGDIYPKVLPFLSCLSKDELTTEELQTEILNSLRRPSATFKGHQLRALLKSYFELCRYFEKLNNNKEHIVKDAFTWLELVLMDENCDAFAFELFSNFLSSYLVFNQSEVHWTEISDLTRRALEKNNFMCLQKWLEAFALLQNSGTEKEKKKIAFDGDVNVNASKDVKKLDSLNVSKLASDICRYCVFEIQWNSGALELITFTIRSFGKDKTFFDNVMAGHESGKSHSGIFRLIEKLNSMNKDQDTANLIATSSSFLVRSEEILDFHSSIICSDSVEKDWFVLLMLGMARIPQQEIRSSLVKSKEFEDKFTSCLHSAVESSESAEQNMTWVMIKDVTLKYGLFLSNHLLEKIILELLKYISEFNPSILKPKEGCVIPTNESVIVLVSNTLETIIQLQDGEVFIRLHSKKDVLTSLFRISCNQDSLLCDDVQSKVMNSLSTALENFITKESSIGSDSIVHSFLEDVCIIVNGFLVDAKPTHVKEVVKGLLSHCNPELKMIVINRIAKEEVQAILPDFPSKELLFEDKIIPLKVLEMDFVDFENEQTRRKRILDFFRCLTNDICSSISGGQNNDEFIENLVRLIYYERSLIFDKSSVCEENHFKTIFKSLSQSDQSKLLDYAAKMSRNNGGLWSLAFNVISNYSDGNFISFEYGDSNLNHKEVILERIEKNATSDVLSYVSECMSKLDIDGMVENMTLASRIIPLVEDFEKFADICFEAIKIKRDEVDLLFSCNVGEMEWKEMLPTLTVIEFLDNYLETTIRRSSNIDHERWVFILCFVSSWMQTIDESSNSFSTKIEVQRFSLPLFRVLEKIGMSILKLDGQEEYAGFLEEWKEFFSAGIYDILLRLFVTISHNDIHHEVINALNGALRYIPMDILHEGAGLPPKFCEEDTDMESGQLPENLIVLLNHLGPLVLSPNSSVQMTASHLLLKLMSKVSKLESLQNEKEDSQKLPARIIYLLNCTEPIVKNIFDEFGFGEPVLINDSINEALTTYLRAYLYTCRFVLQLVASANQELRPSWTEYIRQRNFLDTLVPSLFCLMRIDEPGVRQYTDNNCTDIQKIAFNIYHDLLKFLPAMFRQWWNLADNRVSGIIEKFTINSVSPLLWEEESQTIISSKTTFKNMTVGVRTSVREVVAVYSLDEGSMDLIISLPTNFPLGAVKVDRNQRIGVGHNQWRNWMLQLTTFLQHQNGSILEGLIIWKNNVDKRFEGVEECCICFYILHGANHTLPKLTCRTCRKKFHSACLYKWFSTSNNSTCPLCRNLF